MIHDNYLLLLLSFLFSKYNFLLKKKYIYIYDYNSIFETENVLYFNISMHNFFIK